jgi:GNAT superfamily N-acetyltransferase
LRFQGQKIGSGLLKHASLKILKASRVIAIRAVLVHATNRRPADFYAKNGFIPSPKNSFHMMLMTKDAIKSLGH